MRNLCSIRFISRQSFLLLVVFVLFTGTFIQFYGESSFKNLYNSFPTYKFIRKSLESLGYEDYQELPFLNCTIRIPCVYEEEVDLRIIVITHNRKVSVMKLLESLQGLELDGDRAVLEIWVDRLHDGTVHKETLEAVTNFTWLKGPTRVHVQTAHVGIMGQWIDTWRPKNAPPFQKNPKIVEESLFIPRHYKEIGLILEDDMNVSTQAYKWLKAAHRKYNGRYDYAGTSLWSGEVTAHNSGRSLFAPRNQSAFMYICIGTWGFAPAPKFWAEFQDWFHQIKSGPNSSKFHPYVEGTLPNNWYNYLKDRGRQDTMWEMWFIHFSTKRKLYSVLNNFPAINGNKASCLSINRIEVGLHYPTKGPENLCTLLMAWNTSYDSMIPDEPIKFDWIGNQVN